MKIFFDAEFTGLHKNTSLISLGMVDENLNMFYAEFTDFDQTQLNDWLKENVISNLLYNSNDPFIIRQELQEGIVSIKMKGNSDEIKQALLVWLKQFDTVEWVADVCHYDFVLLIDLLYGDALSIPDNIGASCHDLNQDIASFFKCSEKEAFDKEREAIASSTIIDELGMLKHNSWYDACIARDIYCLVKK